MFENLMAAGAGAAAACVWFTHSPDAAGFVLLFIGVAVWRRSALRSVGYFDKPLP